MLQEEDIEPVILYRKSIMEKEELTEAKKYFSCYERRGLIPRNCLVIGRYSVLPFYKELEDDLEDKGSKLINTRSFHKWIASFEYYDLIEDLTPETWTEDNFFSCNFKGPFVVKGETNSRKFEWNKMMFAPDKRKALEIGCELKKDGLICSQKIIYRKYVPLIALEAGINGLPFTNEYRLFFWNKSYLAGGYYWEQMINKKEERKVPEKAISLGEEVAKRIVESERRGFFVVDVAETTSGRWVVIELNDGQQSGLSGVNPSDLYKGLCEAL